MNLLFSILFASLLSITLLYLGYPLMLILLSKVFNQPYSKSDFHPFFISLVIPCYNERKVIADKLGNSSILDYPKEKLEIIVVDSNSSDGTTEYLKNLEDRNNFKLIFENQRLGKSHAINSALNFATGDIVVITDADAFIAPNALTNIIKNFSDPTIGAVAGKYKMQGNGKLAKTISALFSFFKESLRDFESKIDSASYFTGEFLAFRRELIQRIDDSIVSDDQFILLEIRRKGYRCITEPACLVNEHIVETSSATIKHRRRTTFGTLQVTSKYKSMLFNYKYGAFGCFILPMYLIRILFFPLLLFLIEVGFTFFFIDFFFHVTYLQGLIMAIFLILSLFIFLRCAKILSSVFILQAAIVFGFFDFIKFQFKKTKSVGVWEKLK